MTAPRLLALAPLVAATLTLGGCSLPPLSAGASRSSPVATPAPLSSALSGDDVTYLDQHEALLVAERVITDYLSMSDTIRHDGGEGVERLRPMLSDELYAGNAAEAREWQLQGLRQVGSRTLEGSKLNLVAQLDGTIDIDSNHCIGIGDITFVNAAGDVVEEFTDPPAVIVGAVVHVDRDGNSTLQWLEHVAMVDACENNAP